MTFSKDPDNLLKKRCLVKAVRGWRYFVSTVDGSQQTHAEKPKLRFRAHIPGGIGYSATRGVYHVRDPNKIVDPAYANLKALFSRAQSTTIISPGEGFNPPTFKGLGLGETRVGVLFDAEDEDMVFIKKIISSDTGTVTAEHRRFNDSDRNAEANANLELQLKLAQKTLFSTLHGFIDYSKKLSKPPLNEALARLRWQYKIGAQVCIFSDNLESRLLAQVRAADLSRHLVADSEDQSIGAPPVGYTIPISFYVPENRFKKVWYYNPETQTKDYKKGKSCKKSSKEHALALFLEISQSNFENLNAEEIKTNLYVLLGIASDLTHSSAYLFYEKIKHILFAIDQNNPQLKEQDFWVHVFACIPEEHSKEAFDALLRQFPKLTAHIKSQYMQAELNRCLQTDTELTPQKIELFSGFIQEYFHHNFLELNTILKMGAEKGHKQIVELLVNNSNIANTGALPYLAYNSAKEYGHKDIEVLLDRAIVTLTEDRNLFTARRAFQQYIKTLLKDIETSLKSVILDDASHLVLKKFQKFQENFMQNLDTEDLDAWSRNLFTLFNLYHSMRSYSEHKNNLKQAIGNKAPIHQSFMQDLSQPIYKTETKISFSRDVKPVLATFLTIMLFSLAITAVISACLFVPAIVATGVVPLVVMAKICPALFGASAAYITLIRAISFGCNWSPEKNLLSKLGLYSTAIQSSSKNLIKAMEKDIKKDSQAEAEVPPAIAPSSLQPA